ncbi:MAG TPA: HAMP domain-containing sensor histidine kinase, partial [Thermomicrobiales bacterium]|nr:HAMP domain-containing sensor histidine kinase [Thermomicrobiales bacterium]
DLLDASRLDQGLFQLDVRPVDLAALVRETAAAFATPTNGIEVWTPDELVASIDPDRLRQAIENLLANAIKHSPPGQVVTVRVELEPGDDRRWIVVVVADKGPGIAPELLRRLFDRFSRGPDSAGLGLGLHLAGGIAEAHGGTLTVDSAPGAGARFRLALPDDRAVAEQGTVARATGMLDGGEPGAEPIDAVGIGVNELE